MLGILFGILSECFEFYLDRIGMLGSLIGILSDHLKVLSGPIMHPGKIQLRILSIPVQSQEEIRYSDKAAARAAAARAATAGGVAARAAATRVAAVARAAAKAVARAATRAASNNQQGWLLDGCWAVVGG